MTSRRPQLLFLGTRFPYPQIGGDRIRVYQLISQLQKKYDVTLVTLGQPTNADIQALKAQTNLKNLHVFPHSFLDRLIGLLQALIMGLPFQIGYYKSRFLERWVEKNVNDFDLCVYHLIRTSYVFQDQDPNAPPSVLEMCDAISENFAQTAAVGHWLSPWKWISAIEAKRTLRFERREVNRFDWISLHAAKDAKLLNIPSEKLLISTQGTSALNLNFTKPSNRDGRHVALIGRIDFYPNEAAVRWLSENVLCQLPAGIYLKVVGDCSEKLRKKLQHLPRVILTGRVESIEKACEDCFAAVAPMQVATGIQNKVLEYFALGLPTIVTPSVFSGLLPQANGACFVAEEAQSWIKILSKLSADYHQYDEMADRAYKYIAEYHHWDSIGLQYLDFLSHAQEQRMR